jgi:energy-coupling factor transport system ATP-binding protein
VEPLILVDTVSYTYGSPTPQTEGDAPPPALAEISLQITEGAYVAIVGANGSGKSTLARHLNALLTPDTGSVRIAGLDTRNPRNHPDIRQIVGMIFQRPEDQTVATLVEHDVAFGLENMGLPTAEIRARVDEALEMVDLWEARHRPPHMLSAGQMQRLALAGVLAMRPRCIIFDEVTAMLDPAGRRAVRALLGELRRQGLTLVLITHLMEEVLDADRVVVLDRGRVALEGTPAEIFQDAQRLRALSLDLPPASRLAHEILARVQSAGTPATVFQEALTGALTVPDVVAALDGLPHQVIACLAEQEKTGACSQGARSETPALIEATGLGRTYMAGTPFAHRALHDANIAIHHEIPHGLIGATGSGKSTLLQHLNGLLRPQEGQVRVDGDDLSDPAVDLRQVRRRVGLVFQTPEAQIFEQYVGDEIAYGPRLAGLAGEALRERVRWAMALVELDFETFKDRYTFALSGGEKRKVALAAMLALQPRALLLDEPTAGLDPASRREVLRHLAELQRTGMALAISSHQMEDVAELAAELTVMADGTTVASDGVAGIFTQGEALLAWGLDQPVAAQVAEALRQRGWQLPAELVEPAPLVEHLAHCLLEAEA